MDANHCVLSFVLLSLIVSSLGCDDNEVAIGSSGLLEAGPKDGNRSPRRAGACLPPIVGGRKARRYAELETVLLKSMRPPHEGNELMSQPLLEADEIIVPAEASGQVESLRFDEGSSYKLKTNPSGSRI